MLDKQLYTDVLNAYEEFGKNAVALDKPSVTEMAKAILQDDYHTAWENAKVNAENIRIMKELFTSLHNAVNALVNTSEPAKSLKPHTCVKQTYRECPYVCSVCKYCKNLWKPASEDGSQEGVLVCDYDNQAGEALAKGYTLEEIIAAFELSGNGHCTQFIVRENYNDTQVEDLVPYTDNVQDEETTDKVEESN